MVLASHGAPPGDFPRHELMELMSLRSRLEHCQPSEREAIQCRYAELDARIRNWPRQADNDPFYFASRELAQELGLATGHEVLLGFNEFCAPGLEAALEEAVSEGAERIVVVTPMMTRGGEHAEVDIANVIKQAEERHPEVKIIYAWPFETTEVARFLASHISGFAAR